MSHFLKPIVRGAVSLACAATEDFYYLMGKAVGLIDHSYQRTFSKELLKFLLECYKVHFCSFFND